MRGVRRCLWLVVLTACSAVEGPLLVATTDDAGTAPPSAVDAGAFASPVVPGMRLQYQLQGTVDEAVDVDFFVIDVFNASPEVVQRLHDRGRVVAGYLSAGSHETFRPDADAFPPESLGTALAGYPNERWLDVRDPTVRALMQARLELARDSGFDGVLLSSLDAYEVDSGHDLSAAEQLDYNLWLAAEAHSLGLAAGLADDWAHAGQLAPAYDFAIHFGCIADGRCAELDAYRARGRAVFDLEIDGTAAEVCPEAATLALPVTLKRDGFDAWLDACP
jgi:hypothetical protein